jgi:imidazoleglycerol-phosphate dehydratase/histidinol-phosphatase
MAQKLLFIDRDGTIIKEPPVTFQIENLEQLEFIPGVIRNLYRIINELDYELVMVSNQDGLGTESYPEESFNMVQSKMLAILQGEGITFKNIHIDSSFESENKSSRKPNIGMLTDYFTNDFDLENSFVIGDRKTDVILAKNLKARAIFIQNYENAVELKNDIALIANTWDEIYQFLKLPPRKVAHIRKTNETDITISLNLDGSGINQISTGIAFFDHMLEQIAKHANIDLDILAVGDLHIDEHHTIEDIGITLGEAFNKAWANKKSMERYGFCLPMDDCLAQVAIDFGGRPWIVWNAEFKREKIGEMPTEMFFHFFKSFSDSAKCNLNIKAEGINEHHKIESIFKAFARAIKMAVRRDINNPNLPSTKGIL